MQQAIRTSTPNGQTRTAAPRNARPIEIHRRRFVVALSAGACAAAAGCGTIGQNCNADASAPVDSGIKMSALTEGSAICSTAGDFIVARDANGVYAYSSICPHQGCIVNCPASASSSVVCGCHGSVFNGNGDRVSGPTPTSLDHYVVSFVGTGASASVLGRPLRNRP